MAELPPNEIPFTQYHRPDGREVACTFAVPYQIAKQARTLIGMGYRFTAEVLPGEDGLVCFTCETQTKLSSEEEDDGLIAIQLCENGPDVPAAVEALVLDAVAAVMTKA